MTLERSQERNSNIELLRIVAIVGVLVLHFDLSSWDYVSDIFINKSILKIFQQISICAVNLFMMISGYFMVDKTKVTIRKPVELAIQLAVVSLIVHAIQLYTGSSQFTVEGLVILTVPGDYFIVLYSAVYLFAPFINRALNCENREAFRRLVLLMFLVFSVWNFFIDFISSVIDIPMPRSSTVTFSGSVNGYTVINFVLCYMIGAAIRKRIIVFKKPLVIFVFCIIAGLATTLHDVSLGNSYLNPFVIVQAAAILILAEKFDFHSKAVNVLAKPVFMVYLTHKDVLYHTYNGAHVQGSALSMLMYLALMIFFLYFVGVCAHFIYF